MLFTRCKVIRDVNTVYNRAVPPWELPVLTYIFDEGNVQPTGTFEVVDRPYPDAGIEYDRLTKRYGSDPQTGVPHVAAIYGNARAGIKALGDAIKSAEAEEQAKASEAKPARKSRAAAQQPEADPLLA